MNLNKTEMAGNMYDDEDERTMFSQRSKCDVKSSKGSTSYLQITAAQGDMRYEMLRS